MNKEIFKGKWEQISGRVKATWGKLTDDDLDEIGGRADALAGKIRERYGVAADEAERQVQEFRAKLD